jgi:hypothetical protein
MENDISDLDLFGTKERRCYNCTVIGDGVCKSERVRAISQVTYLSIPTPK